MPNQIRVGNVDIVSVLDMVPPPRDPWMMFPTTAEPDWQGHQDALECGQLQLYYLHFFVRSQGKVIMVDTGMGPGPHPDRGNRTGDLVNQLKNKGVDPAAVDVVAHTHLHADHVGWNVDYSGEQPAPTFPNARYLVPRLDWEHFTKPEVIGTAPQVTNSVVPLEGMGVMELVDTEHNITDEVKTFSAPGTWSSPLLPRVKKRWWSATCSTTRRRWNAPSGPPASTPTRRRAAATGKWSWIKRKTRELSSPPAISILTTTSARWSVSTESGTGR